jgi:hypothetical protein
MPGSIDEKIAALSVRCKLVLGRTCPLIGEKDIVDCESGREDFFKIFSKGEKVENSCLNFLRY